MSNLPDRRTVLKGAGAAAVAAGTAGLVGCGGSEKPSSATPKAAAPVSVPRAQVPEGSGVVLDKQPYVVTQPEAGTYKAFTKTCPHQGCAVAFITNKQIVCPCHSSQFSITDGSRTAGPAKTGLKEYPVKVDGDNLTIG